MEVSFSGGFVFRLTVSLKTRFVAKGCIFGWEFRSLLRLPFFAGPDSCLVMPRRKSVWGHPDRGPNCCLIHLPFYITRIFFEFSTHICKTLLTKGTFMKNLLEELRWRGMVQDVMPGTEEQLAKEMTSGYIGFDPTADSLHIGNLVPIILLIHLQKCGHRPIILVGGATGMVGDPSGKSEERNLLGEDVLNHNINCVKTQLQRFLDFSPELPNAAVLVNNYDWFKTISFLDFIRDVGKHITVNYMMSKDSVRKRLEGDAGMSFTEFTYQLVQGYDFSYLYKNLGCKLQMGGSDQWGNMVTGTELVRRKNGGEAFAFTCPLITKADGSKFGKSEK